MGTVSRSLPDFIFIGENMASERTRIKQNLVAAHNAAKRGQERLLFVVNHLNDVRPGYSESVEEVMMQFHIVEQCCKALIEDQP